MPSKHHPSYMSPEGIAVAMFLETGQEPLNRRELDLSKKVLEKLSEEEKKRIVSSLKKVCKAYLAYYEDDKFIKSTTGYGACCEVAGICSLQDIPSSGSQLAEPFYMQIWFFVACGGVLLLLIIGVVVGLFICRRRKGKSGGSGGGGQSAKGVEAGGKKNKK